MNSEKKTLPYLRRLIFALIISGSVNIFLITWTFLGFIKETPPTPYFEKKPANEKQQEPSLAIDQSNSEILQIFRNLPKESLVTKLNDTQLVENGYTKRDLALAILVAFHQFDLSRALLGQAQPDQKRRICYGVRPNGKKAEIMIFPGLTESQYQAIIHFAKTERWPQTSRGLFALIRQHREKKDPTLADAFFLTQEFLTVEMLFNRAEGQIEKKEILNVIREGDWKMLWNFTEQQRISQDLSPARRQRYLLDYMKAGSKAAAWLMLKTDALFAEKKLDDENVLLILSLLDEKSPEAEQFALALLTSPRSDSVWQMAANRLYDYAKEERPLKNPHHAALLHFIPQATLAKNETSEDFFPLPEAPMPPPKPAPIPPSIQTPPLIKTPPIPKKDKIYIVQHGDSLWKIARRFKVDIDVIRQKNQLESDFLKPGTPLRIP